MEPEPVAGSSRGFPAITQFLVVKTQFFRRLLPLFAPSRMGRAPYSSGSVVNMSG